LSELDEAWALALQEAEQRARAAGRGDLAEYLALRNSNDQLRKVGIDWLISTFVQFAAEANRRGAGIQSSQQDGHRFRIGNATMVGRLLKLGRGVRTVAIEAGWPRTPRDGIIRGGGLACANIKHFGIKAANEELMLVKHSSGAPRWVLLSKTEASVDVHESDALKHVDLLVRDL
jgi:hypothetical protein